MNKYFVILRKAVIKLVIFEYFDICDLFHIVLLWEL